MRCSGVHSAPCWFPPSSSNSKVKAVSSSSKLQKVVIDTRWGGVTKHGATGNRGRVVNLAEAECAALYRVGRTQTHARPSSTPTGHWPSNGHTQAPQSKRAAMNWCERPGERCARVWGGDESILQAVPHTGQSQRWHGLKQQRLCVPPPCLQRQSRHLLRNAPLRYLRADRGFSAKGVRRLWVVGSFPNSSP